MGCLRPATPGFIVTLAATILLAIVSLCVPYIQSVFFLRATISQGGVNGSVTFGTLGYCLELSNGTICSQPSIGYELDINSLVGNNTPLQIPQVVVKWITTALVLHIAALIVAAASALFGLLAHVREMSMTCCSTCISGFAAVIALVAFIFDLVLFFVAKARISSVGSAEMGSAIWLTLAAWVLLFFSGCVYSCGRCCISDRSSRKGSKDDKDKDASDPKGRQDPEGGLPKVPQIPKDAPQPEIGIICGNDVFVKDQYNAQNLNLPPNTYPPSPPQPGVPSGQHLGYDSSNTYPPNPYTYQPLANNYGYYPPPNTYTPPPPPQLSVPSRQHSNNYPSGDTAYHNNFPQVPNAHEFPYAPTAIPDGTSYFSPTGPGQGLNYPQHNSNFYSRSPSPPPQDYSYSLLEPPNQHQSTSNLAARPYDAIPPQSPPPQQTRSYSHDNYEPPYVHDTPSRHDSYQPRRDSYIPGRGVDQVRKSPDDLPPVYTN